MKNILLTQMVSLIYDYESKRVVIYILKNKMLWHKNYTISFMTFFAYKLLISVLTTNDYLSKANNVSVLALASHLIECCNFVRE